MSRTPKRNIRRIAGPRGTIALAVAIAVVVAAGFVASGSSGLAAGQGSSMRNCGKGPQDRLVAVGMTWIDSFNARDLSGWRGILADDFSAVYAPTGPAVLNAQTAEMVNQSFLDAFGDLAFVADRVVAGASCDYVVIHWTASGVHDGPLVLPSGDVIPATNQPAKVSGAYTAEIRSGQIAREWTHWDLLSLMTQLGLIPAP